MSGSAPLASAAIGQIMESIAAAQAVASTSAEFYEELRDGFAKDMVAQFATGAVVLLKPNRAQGPTINPLNPYSGVPTRTTRNAIVTGYPTDKIDGERILASDRQVLIDAADFTVSNTPAGDDQVEIDGRVHILQSLKAVPAAGVAVIYIMQARTAGPG